MGGQCREGRGSIGKKCIRKGRAGSGRKGKVGR